jgi:hypothetical protein
MESRRWSTAHNTDTQDTSLGLHVANLPTLTLNAGTEMVFTFLWLSRRALGRHRLPLLGLSKQAEKGNVPMPRRYQILELVYGDYQRCL